MDNISLIQEQQEDYKTNIGNLQQDVLTAIIRRDKDEATELIVTTLQLRTKFYATQFDERSEVYYYKEGIFKPEGRTFIKSFCRKVLGSAYTEQLANRVVSKIEADNYIDQNKLLTRHYPELICINNGIFNLKTKELSEWSSEKIFLNKIPITYDSTATCPLIESFLRSTLPDQKDIDTIYEFFGYCLIGGYPVQKIALFIGEGGNGKSQVLKMLKKFIGDNNSCAIPLQKFEENDFKEVELFGKLVNISSEISDKPLKTTAKIKSLSGGDEINASRKFKNDLTFENETKLIFPANKLPKTYDTSKAFFRRWIYIMFPYKFLPQEEYDLVPEDKRDKIKLACVDVADKITKESELNGLFNKAIDGLGRLLSKGSFTSSKTNEDTMLWWIRNSDSFLAFCWEKVEESPEGVIYKDDLRKQYQKFCRENKLVAEGDKHIHEVFTRQILAWDYQETEGERAWGGVAWKK
jgi:putative DNA primase/helicase